MPNQFFMADLGRENARARAYPVSDVRDPRLSSATNGQGLPPGGRRRLENLVQTRKIKLATLNVGSMTGRSGEVVHLMARKNLQVICVQETNIERELGERDWWWVQVVLRRGG